MFGKTTARMHYASGDYIASNNEPFGKKVIYKALESLKYNVVLDTKGSLCWNTNQIDFARVVRHDLCQVDDLLFCKFARIWI